MIDFIKVQAHPDTLPGKTPTAAQLEKVAAIKAMNGGLLS
jgi:hypothetical protein